MVAVGTTSVAVAIAAVAVGVLESSLEHPINIRDSKHVMTSHDLFRFRSIIYLSLRRINKRAGVLSIAYTTLGVYAHPLVNYFTLP